MTLFTIAERSASTSFVKNAAAVVAGSLLLWLAAKIVVPFYPVPQTMQTFVVIGLGLALGPKLAVAAISLYLVEGLAGLPVFARSPENGIGLSYMMGPTGGYLAGYLVAGYVAGILAEKGWGCKPLLAASAALLAGAIIYLPGLLWLGAVIGWEKPLFSYGLYPFLLGDFFKALLAALVFPAASKAIGGRTGK